MTESRAYALLRREPLVGFVLAAGLIFVLYALVADPGAGDTRIVVTPQVIDAIEAERELVLGRPLQPDERDALVQQYINEEVLVREAYAQGLDRVDGKVRGQLIRKMTFLLEEEPPEPTAADLQALYAADPARYRLPARIDVLQVLPGEGVDAGKLLVKLRDDKVVAAEAGTVQPMEKLSAQELSMVLDAQQSAALMKQAVGDWSGPYALAQGTVLIQVTGRYPAREFPPEQLQGYLREDWLTAQRREVLARKLAELRRGYTIEQPAGETGSLQAAER